jgi:hypothetical protein
MPDNDAGKMAVIDPLEGDYFALIQSDSQRRV